MIRSVFKMAAFRHLVFKNLEILLADGVQSERCITVPEFVIGLIAQSIAEYCFFSIFQYNRRPYILIYRVGLFLSHSAEATYWAHGASLSVCVWVMCG